MSLAQWDREVAPYLRDIRRACRWINTEAKNALISVGRLPVRPEFVTEAEVALSDAEQDTLAALRAIRQAKRNYSTLRTEPQHMEAAE